MYCLCVYLRMLYFQFFGEKEYSKILQLLIFGAVLVWCFSFIFNSWTNEKVVKYETVNECPIAEVTEGDNYNKLPLAEASKMYPLYLMGLLLMVENNNNKKILWLL